MHLKVEVESEEKDVGTDGGDGEGSERSSCSSSHNSSSSGTSHYSAGIKDEEKEKDDGSLAGMDPILFSAEPGEDVPVFDQAQLDLMFY
jgi:hypothetical protein